MNRPAEAPANDSGNHPLLDAVFHLYKSLVSPLLHAVSPSQCLYRPTCSEYAYVALARFGLLRGGWLALRRVARCHPWAHGGLDPVPTATGSPVGTFTPPQPAEPEDHLP